MLRIGICDDSEIFIQDIKKTLSSFSPNNEKITLECFDNGDDLISAHLSKPFDIILLDVIMPLLGGIDVAKEIREKDKTVKIVFLTSSSEFAVDSYTVKASNYLIKPIDKEKLFSCLNELYDEIVNVSRCITVRGLHASYRIRLSEIEYIESQGKHIVFALYDGKTIISTEPLYAYEDKLILEDGFFKCHRSYIVNIHYISSYSPKEILMHSGCRIPISRNSHKAFESAFFAVFFEEDSSK